jgi:hypothetical protein
MNVKFLWNGIKVDGTLHRAWYSDGDRNGSITIFAKDYHDFPKVEGLVVKNDSDSQQDCFHKDHIKVQPDNPHYPAIMEAFKAQEDRRKGKAVQPDADVSPLMKKVQAFAAKVDAAELESLIRNQVDCQANRDTAHALIIPGKKYIKVDIGSLDRRISSGRYMVDVETEQIFGIKGYGVVHKGHRYGTLDNPVIRARY